METKHMAELTSNKPLYLQIVDLFRERIRAGDWPVHTKLKDEVALSKELGVSRGTLRNALRHLIRQGVIVQVKGRGTFVASGVIEQPLATRLISFSEALKEQGYEYTTKVLRTEKLCPDDRTRAMLELPADTPVWGIERLRYVKAEPIILLRNYVPVDVLPDLESYDLASSTIFGLLELRTGSRLDWGRRYFRAVGADDKVAAHMAVPDGYPLLQLEQVVYSTRSRPLEFSLVWINSDNFDVVATLAR